LGTAPGRFGLQIICLTDKAGGCVEQLFEMYSTISYVYVYLRPNWSHDGIALRQC
jgi:hypothetical protein